MRFFKHSYISRKFFSTNRIITPLHYFGSRENIVDDIFKLSNGKPINSFYDPFSGSGSISFAAMEQKKAQNFYLNDSLPILKNLWEWVRTHPNSMVNHYCELLESYYEVSIFQRSNVYEKLLEQLKHPFKMLDNSYSAALFAFLINYSEKNIPTFDTNLELSTKPNLEINEKSKQLEARNFSEKIHYLSHLLQTNNVIFSSGDYKNCIENVKKGDFIVFDPPYPQQAHNIYYNIRSEIDLRKNLSQTFLELNEKQVDFIILYGAGNIPTSVQFNNLKLQHLIRLSFHSLFGEFLEHIYVSPSIALNSTCLPPGIVFYDSLFKSINGTLSSINYDSALRILHSAKKSNQVQSILIDIEDERRAALN